MKERYLRSVQALLDCPETERERLLRRQDSAMTAYLADEPEATEADLLDAFGTPEDCAARLLAECDPAALAAERGGSGGGAVPWWLCWRGASLGPCLGGLPLVQRWSGDY